MNLLPLQLVLAALVARDGETPVVPAWESVDLVPAVTRAELEAHVRFLSADERAGRVTGSAQAGLCAQYLAKVLEREGLVPAGDDGTFLQRVPLERQRWTAPPELILDGLGTGRRVFLNGRDFDGGRGWKAGHDLRLLVVQDPAQLPATADREVALFFDAPSAERTRAFERANLGAGEGFGLVLVPGASRGTDAAAATPRGSLERKTSGAQREPPRALRVHGEALAALRAGNGLKIGFEPHVEVDELMGHNVVARIPGAGTPAEPALREEALVVTAHYDHIDHGARPAHEGEDTIYNGADDDASGTAAVLEIAGALAHGPRPARTVVIALVTGEEIGLVGTDEYLDRPVVPLVRTVLNLNFEMIGRPDEKVGGSGALWLTGYELTNLGPVFQERGLAIRPDPYPQQHFFERSDNIAFVRRGVVGQTLSSYNLHQDYHRPSDEVGRIDFAHMELATRAGLEAAKLVAEGAVRPAWTPGREPRQGRR